jgi:hypothetical protein
MRHCFKGSKEMHGTLLPLMGAEPKLHAQGNSQGFLHAFYTAPCLGGTQRSRIVWNRRRQPTSTPKEVESKH